MISSAFKRYFNEDYKKNPIIGNLQYKAAGVTSPTLLASSCPYIGSVNHAKIFDYHKELERRKKKEEKRVKCIFIELSQNKNDWVTVSTSFVHHD